MATKKIEIQDHQGNVYYPHTTVDVVFMKDGRKAENVITGNETSILELQAELGTNKSTLEANINAIREVL